MRSAASPVARAKSETGRPGPERWTCAAVRRAAPAHCRAAARHATGRLGAHCSSPCVRPRTRHRTTTWRETSGRRPGGPVLSAPRGRYFRLRVAGAFVPARPTPSAPQGRCFRPRKARTLSSTRPVLSSPAVAAHRGTAHPRRGPAPARRVRRRDGRSSDQAAAEPACPWPPYWTVRRRPPCTVCTPGRPRRSQVSCTWAREARRSRWRSGVSRRRAWAGCCPPSPVRWHPGPHHPHRRRGTPGLPLRTVGSDGRGGHHGVRRVAGVPGPLRRAGGLFRRPVQTARRPPPPTARRLSPPTSTPRRPATARRPPCGRSSPPTNSPGAPPPRSARGRR